MTSTYVPVFTAKRVSVKVSSKRLIAISFALTKIEYISLGSSESDQKKNR